MRSEWRRRMRESFLTSGQEREKLCRRMRLAVDWVRHSGIQDLCEGSETCGAVRSWYDAKAKSFGGAYPEATGYAMTFFAYLFSLWGEDQDLFRGERAARWLRETAVDPDTGLVRDGTSRSARTSYSFDNGMIAAGFLNLYRVTGDPQYLDMGRRILDATLRTMQDQTGFFWGRYNLARMKVLTQGRRWSQRPGCHHMKIAIPLGVLYGVTGEEEYLRKAQRLIEWGRRSQMQDGGFVSRPHREISAVHRHCYALEGLLAAGIWQEDIDLMKSFSWGIRWLLLSSGKGGRMPENLSGCLIVERADTLAQCVRLLALSVRLGIVPDASENAMKVLLRRLLCLQSRSSLPSEKGGFRFCRTVGIPCRQHINPWATFFAVQAMGSSMDDPGRIPELEYWV